MFRSLRSKLIISYSLVILLCLILAGSAFVYILRDYQRQLRLNQLADLTTPISWQVQLLQRAGATAEQMSSFLKDRATEMDVRILLVDSAGLVVEDTGNTLEGDHVQMVSAGPRRDESRAFSPVTVVTRTQQGFVFITATGRAAPPPPDRSGTRLPAVYSVILAVPEQSLTASWMELAPSLSLAALISLILSIGVAWLLSRSISRPVTAITRASEEMARGNYDQNIGVKGRDEVGRLAEAFNEMAHQVSISHRTLRDFLANVSHELRTPLTSVQGFSQAMVDGTAKSPEEYAEAAEIINEEAGRMRRLVEDLLLLSKIESRQLPIDRATLDLRELLKGCIKRSQPQAQQSSIALELFAEQPAQVVGDEGRLEQVFRNLLDNALRHTPEGGIVTVRLDPPSPQYHPALLLGKEGHGSRNGVVRVTVHNSGSYIPPEERERIFERFYQGDRARVRDSEGSGLGLSIAREIVHAHGGAISVESDPARGTSFVVAMPPTPGSGQPPPAK